MTPIVRRAVGLLRQQLGEVAAKKSDRELAEVMGIALPAREEAPADAAVEGVARAAEILRERLGDTARRLFHADHRALSKAQRGTMERLLREEAGRILRESAPPP
eukprot:CAMPEP_0194337498 /NCGR_PEP_ID=MMETSP0171-20130528/76533_1 /TAXON_ID=218684 /ORGANISM="Corethron pennatum, Strain L29A3" /LENGTH=104 /DNA_ID=CAMNT_0039101301 /DNA_START=8 /DNA_END=319 /DNA_ORIENTATION=+